LQQVEEGEESELEEVNLAQDQAESEQDDSRWGNGAVELTGVRMRNAAGDERWLYHTGEEVTVEVDYVANQAVEDLVFGVGILRADGLSVIATNTDLEEVEVPPARVGENGTFRFTIDSLPLAEDSYFLDVAAHNSNGLPYDYHHRMHKFSIRSSVKFQGVLNPAHSWSFTGQSPKMKKVG